MNVTASPTNEGSADDTTDAVHAALFIVCVSTGEVLER